MPIPQLSEEEIDLLYTGCRQIQEGKGQTPENPLTEIGSYGFYLLIGLFHFKLGMQEIIKSQEDGFLDKMKCFHMITKEELVLFNFVKS